MIKAVLFDAGGVLHVANTDVGDDLQKELGLSDEQVARIFSYYLPLMGTGKMSEQDVWDDLQKQYGIRAVTESEHLFTRNFEPSLQKIPGMYELVAELKAQDLTVGLLTNVTPQFAEVLRAKGHYDPFTIKILSYEVGLWKPDIKIYEYAVESLNLKPEEILFIDDQVKNITAAKSAGMHGIVFESAKQAIDDTHALLVTLS